MWKYYRQFLTIAFANLKKRSLRSWLTMLGIIIGIAAVVSLVSLGQGMQDAINSQFASIGTDKLIISGTDTGFGPPGQTAAGKIDDHDLRLIRSSPGIDRAAGRLIGSVNVEFDDENQVTFGASLPKQSDDRDLVLESLNVKMFEGRILKSSETKKVVVGYNIWSKHKKEVALGAKLLVNGEKFEIVGILDKLGAGRDDAILMNDADIRSLLNKKDEYSAIIAQLSPGEDSLRVSDRLLRTMRRDRGQKEGFEDITVETSQELIDSINVILGVVQAVFIGIAAISLLVGGIGIMNTMYTSVMERTREIGIMKAIGARNSDVLTLFLIESGLLGLCGGAMGVILGIGLSKLVELGGRGAMGDLLSASFPPSLIIGALVFSFVIGALSGILPAMQASKMQPVEALRQ